MSLIMVNNLEEKRLMMRRVMFHDYHLLNETHTFELLILPTSELHFTYYLSKRTEAEINVKITSSHDFYIY